MTVPILTVNSGSSSLKASLFTADGQRRDFYYGHVQDQHDAFDQLMRDLGDDAPQLVGHRFVHGGEIHDAASIVDTGEYARLESLSYMAPLHMPGNLMGVEMCAQRFPVPQIACFDTAFHATMPPLSWRLPLPSELGFRRFGFHGLNYAHIARRLPEFLEDAAAGSVLVAHLGSGSSMCLMQGMKSVDTSMGYTPAGGIVMGTRSGDIDPGVILKLAKRYKPEALSDLVYHQMGLLALSDGESSEMSDLLASNSESAQFAVDYYCRQARAAIGAYAAKAGGLDVLVFTAGIGEHSAEVRTKICDGLQFMGIELDDIANRANESRIEKAGTKPVLIIPSDEERMIRDLCLEFA
jgi:acetate kinase